MLPRSVCEELVSSIVEKDPTLLKSMLVSNADNEKMMQQMLESAPDDAVAKQFLNSELKPEILFALNKTQQHELLKTLVSNEENIAFLGHLASENAAQLAAVDSAWISDAMEAPSPDQLQQLLASLDDSVLLASVQDQTSLLSNL